MGLKRLSLLVGLSFILLSGAVFANVVLEDSFESGLSGWLGHIDAFEITGAQSRTGIHALLNKGNSNTALTRDIGELYDVAYECSFYDFGDFVSETLCVVSNEERPVSKSSLLIGIETAKSKDFYSYFLSPDANSWGVTNVPRSKGWHKAVFYKSNGKTQLFLDTTHITETSNINNWKYIGVTLNNWNIGGHGYALYDDLRISTGIQNIQTLLEKSSSGIFTEEKQKEIVDKKYPVVGEEINQVAPPTQKLNTPKETPTQSNQRITQKQGDGTASVVIIVFIVILVTILILYLKRNEEKTSPTEDDTSASESYEFSLIDKYEDTLQTSKERGDYSSSLEKEVDAEKIRLRNNEEEFMEKMHQLQETKSYDYIKKFVEKYGDEPDYDNLDKLRRLLLKEGFEFSEIELQILILEELEEQRYQKLKKKILAKNPKSLDDFLNLFIQIYEENYHDYVSLLHRLLLEKKKRINENKLEEKLAEIKETIEVQMFKEKLKKSDKKITLQQIDRLNGHEFEGFLYKLFEKMGYKVERMKLSQDQGADLVATKHGEKTVIQAKRYGSSVNNSAVQEVVASIKHYNADKGMVVTTSIFTKSAKELAESNKIRLVDRSELNELINKYF